MYWFVKFQNICGMRRQEDSAVEDCWQGGSVYGSAVAFETSTTGNCYHETDGITSCGGDRCARVNESLVTASKRFEDRWAPIRGVKPRCLDRRLATLPPAIVDEQQNRFVFSFLYLNFRSPTFPHENRYSFEKLGKFMSASKYWMFHWNCGMNFIDFPMHEKFRIEKKTIIGF